MFTWSRKDIQNYWFSKTWEINTELGAVFSLMLTVPLRIKATFKLIATGLPFSFITSSKTTDQYKSVLIKMSTSK